MGGRASRGLRRAIEIRADRVAEDVERINGLEGDLVAGRGHAGRQRHSAQVEEALHGCIVRSPHRERIVVLVDPSGDRVAVVAVEVGAGDKTHGVPIKRVALRVERPGYDVHALHADAVSECDGSLDGNGVGRGDLLAGKAGHIRGCDGIDAVQRGDVVPAQLRRVGNARAAARAADAAIGLHHRPALQFLCSARRTTGERAGVHLRVVKPENPSEGSLQFKAHHLEFAGAGCAEAVEQNDPVSDRRIRVDVVEPREDAVVLATVLRAHARAEDGIDHRTVGVEDDAQRKAGGRGGHVGRRGDDSQLVGLLACDREVHAVDDDVRAAHVFVERAFVGERNPGRRNRAPEGRRRIHHGRCLLMADRGVQRSLIDVVVQLPVSPVNGLAHHRRVEEADPGHVFGSAGQRRRGRQQRQQKPSCGAVRERWAEVKHESRSGLWRPVRLKVRGKDSGVAVATVLLSAQESWTGELSV